MMLSIPCFLCAVMIVYTMTICCSYDKRDTCVKLISFCNYLLLFGFFVPFCLLCFVFALVERGRECACSDGVYDYYTYNNNEIDHPLSLGPALNKTNGYWMVGCAKTTANSVLWIGALSPAVFLGICLCACAKCCNKIKSIDMIKKVKPRMVKNEI